MNRSLTDMEDDSSDLEVEQLSSSNEFALKVVAARKAVHLLNDFHAHDRARNVAGDAWSTCASSGDTLSAHFQTHSDPIHYSGRTLPNPKEDSRFMSPQSQSPASFKYNAEASPFRAFDSPRVAMKKKKIVPHPSIDSAIGGGIISIERKRNFSITPGPNRNHLSSADEIDVMKSSSTAVHDSPQQFQLFNSKASAMDEWVIPNSFITTHHFASTSQTVPSTTIPASPDIMDIFHQMVSEQQQFVGDYIDDLDHTIAFHDYSPSKASAAESRMDPDLDICSIARDVGTLNLHKSASSAKDFTLPYGDKHAQHVLKDLSRSYSIGDRDANADNRLNRDFDRSHRSEEIVRSAVAIPQLKLSVEESRHEPYFPLVEDGGAPHNGLHGYESMRVMEESDHSSTAGRYSWSTSNTKTSGSCSSDYFHGASIMRLEHGTTSSVISDPKHVANALHSFDASSSWDTVAALSAPKHDPNYEPPIPLAPREHRSSSYANRSHGVKGSSHSHHVHRHSNNKEDPAWNQLLLSKDSDTNSSIASNHSSKRRSDVNHASTVRPSKDALKIAISGPVSHAKPDVFIFIESPRSKAAYKDFFKHFRLKEKDSLDAARRFALDALLQMPENAKWRVYLELADLAKRHNLIQEARNYYSEVCLMQPRANMGWLEWSKMEEENGRLRRALNILSLGLKVCKVNESLLTRVIRLQERLHKYSEVRGMLSVLKYESVDRIWKSVLEGTLFEARTGNIAISRKLFKYLMKHVSWYGPIYFEAFRLEEKEGNDGAALDIIRRGLAEIPKYGPLWLGLLRIMEREDSKIEQRSWQTGCVPKLSNVCREVEGALTMISKELMWKIYFDKSQAEERAADVSAIGLHMHSDQPLHQCRDKMLKECRRSLLRSLLVCPANLRWRILLVCARLELSVDKVDSARDFINRAFQEVPSKSKCSVYLECSRLEEYVGNADRSRRLLLRAQQETASAEWKVYLESILLEARTGSIDRAALIASEAVECYPCTGRLWAVYIQLAHRLESKLHYKAIIDAVICTDDVQSSVSEGSSISHLPQLQSKESIIRQAISEVPKSGEVWCERGRCSMNPLNTRTFDLSQSLRSLCFANQFTPQYGDTFIEYIRVELVAQVLLPRVLDVLDLPVLSFFKAHLAEDEQSDLFEAMRDLSPTLLSQQPARGASMMQLPTPQLERQRRRARISAVEGMSYDFGDLSASYHDVSLKHLTRRCINADPNYGFAWFHCRLHPNDIPSLVLNTARLKITQELLHSQNVYARGLLHYIHRCSLKLLTMHRKIGEGVSSSDLSLWASTDLITITSPDGSLWPSSAPPPRPPLASGDIDIIHDDETSRSMDVPPTGSLHVDRSLSQSMHSSQGGREFVLAREDPMGVQLDRVSELIEDITSALPMLSPSMLLPALPSSASQFIPFIQTREGTLYCYSDFVTGLVEMNRSFTHNQLASDAKRSLLLGADFIVS